MYMDTDVDVDVMHNHTYKNRADIQTYIAIDVYIDIDVNKGVNIDDQTRAFMHAHVSHMSHAQFRSFDYLWSGQDINESSTKPTPRDPHSLETRHRCTILCVTLVPPPELCLNKSGTCFRQETYGHV